MVTRRLHLDDALISHFDATVQSIGEWQGRPAVILDQTAFYAEAGGQLADAGSLSCSSESGPLLVVDVQVDDAGVVWHVIDAVPPWLAPGLPVRGEIDARRRRDFMSQHSGQHVLSAALLREAGAATVSSRLGATASTIDVNVFPLSADLLARAVEAANEVVLEDRPIRVLWPTPEELAQMSLRKQPGVHDRIRVVRIEELDLSACGGTHCTSTGQIGPIHVTSVEKYKGMTRITFLAGQRAIAHHLGTESALRELARVFTCGPFDVISAVAKLRDELAASQEECRRARDELASLLADQVHSKNPAQTGGPTRVQIRREGADILQLRAIAAACARRPDVVATVAGRAPDGEWMLVVERGADAAFDAGRWLKETAKRLGGKGGGRPERAEGRFPAALSWDDLTQGDG